MTEGESEVRGVGEIANEANTALSELLTGIGRIAEVIADVTTVSREQSSTMRQLADVMDGVQGVSNEAAAQARDASDAAVRQTRALEGLAETSRGLALLAERLRRSTGRFTVAASAGEASVLTRPNGDDEGPGGVMQGGKLGGPARSLSAA
jgi:methyl-accepting chemotaxis protein